MVLQKHCGDADTQLTGVHMEQHLPISWMAVLLVQTWALWTQTLLQLPWALCFLYYTPLRLISPEYSLCSVNLLIW